MIPTIHAITNPVLNLLLNIYFTSIQLLPLPDRTGQGLQKRKGDGTIQFHLYASFGAGSVNTALPHNSRLAWFMPSRVKVIVVSSRFFLFFNIFHLENIEQYISIKCIRFCIIYIVRKP